MKKAMKSMKKKGEGAVVSFYEFLSFCFCTSIKMAKKAMKSMKKKGSMKKAMKSMKKKGHHEAPQSHESVSDREGQARQVFSFSWSQGQDLGGIEEAGSHQKQVGKSCIQKNERSGQVSIQKKNGLAKWNAACQKARKDLKLKGFVPIGGKTSP